MENFPMFNIGDLIYYVVGGTVKYGRCIGFNKTGDTIVSFVVQSVSPPYTNATVLVADARASGYVQVSMTPSNTPYPTRTPNPSASPSMTVTPSPFTPPNLFPPTTTGWTLGNVSMSVQGANTKITTTGGAASFSKTFTVVPNKYYNFGFDFGQGTVRFAKMTLNANGGQTFMLNEDGNTDSGEIVSTVLSDSGSVNAQMYVSGTTSVTITYDLYNDASLTNPPAGLFYVLSDTVLSEVVINVSLSPSLSATPTPSPTLSVSASNYAELTPSPTPTTSNGGVTPSPTATHTPTVTPPLF